MPLEYLFSKTTRAETYCISFIDLTFLCLININPRFTFIVYKYWTLLSISIDICYFWFNNEPKEGCTWEICFPQDNLESQRYEEEAEGLVEEVEISKAEVDSELSDLTSNIKNRKFIACLRYKLRTTSDNCAPKRSSWYPELKSPYPRITFQDQDYSVFIKTKWKSSALLLPQLQRRALDSSALAH